LADEMTGFALEEMAVKRLSIATILLGTLFNGCAAAVDAGSAAPAPISPTQFLRPDRDITTGTWIAAWVDPVNHQFVSGTWGQQDQAE
jgi:hypothetical protein